MNKTLTIIVGSIFALFVVAAMVYIFTSVVSSPPATATPTATLEGQFPTQGGTAVTEAASASPTLTLTEPPSPTEPPTVTALPATATPRVVTATPGRTPTTAMTATSPGAAATTPAATSGAGPASVSASNQVLGADNSLVVARVVSPSQGWIVIYSDEGGHPGAVMGFAPVSPGQNDNVKVTLSATANTPGTFWAVLLMDAGTIGTFEFPGADTPVRDASGNFAEVSFQVTQ